MFTNRSKTKIIMVAIAASAMLFAGCSKKVEVDAHDSNKPSSSAPSTAPTTNAINTGANGSNTGTNSNNANATSLINIVTESSGKPFSNSVHFAFDSAALDTAARATLKGYATWLKSNSANNITIEGNCDQRGSREYNLALGQQRADSIRDYLTARGVKSSHVDTISFGEERPVCTGSGEACWAKNRRGDLVTR